MCQRAIANIDISKEYDESMGSNDVHYQSFARMADFFGRDMQAHRHDQFFQMHFLDTGQIELQLDDHRYSVQAPLFVLTPPSVPHAFITESRLTDICRRFANRPPKRLIFDRQLREAKRLLLFSDNAVNEIAWQLGFKDPAYFARFFNRLAGCSPSQFRQREVPSFLN
ncbi:helix-turn-helix domain-containing protein [Salmonella enterica subsp. enterica serovar 4,[5],12:i:-]|nr:helix-turn-helix domain-containing protein [Salmonella enterica]EBE5784656.1 helix-turn-helix domain-containing protein [Salmonella enterica]EDU6405159.1 helix-turn-helix domain-containing protein [Salmonella enterica subsp. enterica serovar 4,[5],12:i:-]EGX0263515.1 helix-turn-helix domain-containing protein [Salmonella enterica]EHN2195973.1 helix-turn-helix domain-containing protein [Salmonella enterica subsp. enterica serovar 4,[5],12:i:-]